MTGPTKLNINAPEEMYTRSPLRVDHLIAAHEWAIIKRGDGNYLIDYALVAFGAGLGFLQNAYAALHWAFFATPITGWDVLASTLCGIFFALAFAFYIASRAFKSECERVIKEIDNRQPQPFYSEDGTPRASLPPAPGIGPAIRGRSIESILQDAMKRSPKQ